ncbi:hypothetical protein D3C79_863540 [compost metagenome]
MLCPPVTEALGADIDGADGESVVGMRFEDIAFDMGVVKLYARQLRQLPELRAIFFEGELLWNTLHSTSISCTLPPCIKAEPGLYDSQTNAV